MAAVWQYYAHQRHGELDKEDEELIAKSIRVYVSHLDFHQDGYIDFADFMTFMLGINLTMGKRCVK